MAIELQSNSAVSTLALPLLASGNGSTTITLASGTGALFPQTATQTFPPGASSFFRLSLTDANTQTIKEIVYCTARNGDVLTVVRAQDGTSALAWNAGDIAGVFVVAGTPQNLMQVQQAQAGSHLFAVASGTANAIVANLTPAAIQALTPGLTVQILITATNTGPTTLNLNGFGAQPVLNRSGGPLLPSALIAGVDAQFVWLGSNWSTVGSNLTNIPYLTDTGTANNIVVSTGLNLTGIASGYTLFVRVANTNTGSTALKLDGLAPVVVQARNAAPLVSGVMLGANVYEFVYTGSVFIAPAITNSSVGRVGEIVTWFGNPSNIPSVFGAGWFACNGQVTPGGFQTPDTRDKYKIGAGNLYTPGQTGGSNSITLTQAQLPQHTHVVQDAGHTHTTSGTHNHPMSDPGHVHGVGDPGHAHGVSDPGHAHALQSLGSVQAGSDNGGAMVSVSTGAGSSRLSQPTFASGTGIGIFAAGTGIFIGGAATNVSTVAASANISNSVNTTGITVATTPPQPAQPVTVQPMFAAFTDVIYAGS